MMSAVNCSPFFHLSGKGKSIKGLTLVHFRPARNALALAASLCLAGGLACEAGGHLKL